jgi:hypothetical protein
MRVHFTGNHLFIRVEISLVESSHLMKKRNRVVAYLTVRPVIVCAQIGRLHYDLDASFHQFRHMRRGDGCSALPSVLVFPAHANTMGRLRAHLYNTDKNIHKDNECGKS